MISRKRATYWANFKLSTGGVGVQLSSTQITNYTYGAAYFGKLVVAWPVAKIETNYTVLRGELITSLFEGPYYATYTDCVRSN